jgi:imidazoleglycerol-phosphate dehydratase
MEDVVSNVTVDISGRGSYRPDSRGIRVKDKEGYSFDDAEHFLESFAKHLGVNLIISIKPLSLDLHIILETVFKALGIALDQATQIDPRRKGVPSTKGVID